MNLGWYFQKKREAAGLSQKEVATVLGYKSSQLVSNWERGICMPPVMKMALIAKLFSIPKDELIEVLLDDYRKWLLKESGLNPHPRK